MRAAVRRAGGFCKQNIKGGGVFALPPGAEQKMAMVCVGGIPTIGAMLSH